MRQLVIEKNNKTNRNRTIELYFNDLNRREKLTPQEETELAFKIKEGDLRALNALVEANLRFVVSVAKQYAHDATTLSELIAQGNLGLIEAAHKYDPSTGFKFISYAVWYIRKEILLYYSSLHKTVAMPVAVETDLRRVKRVENELEMRLERKPTTEEIVRVLATSKKPLKEAKVEALMKEEAVAVALDSKSEENDFAPIDVLCELDPELDRVSNLGDAGLPERLFSSLTQVEREVVCRRLGLNGHGPTKAVDVEEALGKGKGWAQYVYKVALRKMSISLKNEKNEF